MSTNLLERDGLTGAANQQLPSGKMSVVGIPPCDVICDITHSGKKKKEDQFWGGKVGLISEKKRNLKQILSFYINDINKKK